MKAVVYIRVSTDEQKLGPKAQQDQCEKFCEREGIEISGIFVDHGVSGSSPVHKRDGLIEAINSIGKGDILLVAKRCRLARSVFNSSMIEKSVNDNGGRVVSADGVGHGDTPEAVLMGQLIDAFAQYELTQIRLRTKAALKRLKDEGKRTGQIPFGYAVDESNTLIKCGYEQGIKDNILELHQSGMSTRAIAKQLQVENLKGRKGFLSHVQVHRIIKKARVAA